MSDNPLSQDPTEEATGSAVFVPLADSLLRKLERADDSGQDSSVYSEPSADQSERRYSDLSVESVADAQRCSSPATAELIRQWNLTVRDPDVDQHSPPVMRDRARDRDASVRSFGQPISLSSTGLSPSVSRRWEETLPAGSRNVEERKRSNAHPSNVTFESRRYEFYGVGESNPGYFSSPYFSMKPVRPEPVRPIVPQEPQKKKISSLWKFLSGKTRPKRERRTEVAPQRQSFQGPPDHVREKRTWKVESFRRLRRSGRQVTNLEEVFAHEKNISTAAPPLHPDIPRKEKRRPRSSARSPGSSVTTDQQYTSPARTHPDEPSSLGILPAPVSHPNGERLGSLYEAKREANSFAGYRGRFMFTTEGSSVSSLSDREEEGIVESSQMCIPRRQLRAMQYVEK